MTSDRGLVAHLLRRTTFGPHPGQVEQLAGRGIGDAINAVLADDGGRPHLPAHFPDGGALARWWLKHMADPAAGLREKLTWFWHGHLPSSDDKVGETRLLREQYLLLRASATGGFADLIWRITVDPAMLRYLDGEGSTGETPNENYGRELMELFTIGRGNYTQADVRAASLALSGWSVGDDHRANFDPEAAFAGPVTLLGRTGPMAAADVVRTVCDHPACPRFIATKLHRYLAGTDPSPDRLDAFSEGFRSSGLSIRWLVEAIVRDPAFLEQRMNRPRYPVEWVAAASTALGITDAAVMLDAASNLGQVPFQPPNVAGWPSGVRWLNASARLAEAALTAQTAPLAKLATVPDVVGACLDRCSMFEMSSSTLAALHTLADGVSDPSERAALVLGATVASPEFALA